MNGSGWRWCASSKPLPAERDAFAALARALLVTEHQISPLMRGGERRRIAWTEVIEDGAIGGFGRDATAEVRAEEALRQSQELEVVGQFTGGGAHDFNNLLTVPRPPVDLSRRPNLGEERRRRDLDAVSDTVDRAAGSTSQLLSFAAAGAQDRGVRRDRARRGHRRHAGQRDRRARVSRSTRSTGQVWTWAAMEPARDGAGRRSDRSARAGMTSRRLWGRLPFHRAPCVTDRP